MLYTAATVAGLVSRIGGGDMREQEPLLLHNQQMTIVDTSWLKGCRVHVFVFSRQDYEV